MLIVNLYAKKLSDATYQVRWYIRLYMCTSSDFSGNEERQYVYGVFIPTVRDA